MPQRTSVLKQMFSLCVLARTLSAFALNDDLFDKMTKVGVENAAR
jgi:hypothetical protein